MMRGSVTTKEAVIAARSSRSPLERAPSTGVSIAEKRIPGKPGDPDVRIYIVNAGPKAQARPAILHIHGGGYILGTAASGLADLQDLARDLDCVIVTVDYRLAPETAFPGPLEDCYAGLKWLHANVGALGVDPARIAVKGESAGGGLAAMLAIAARDRKEVPLAYQCLIYPMLDDRTGSTVHRPPQQGALMWTPQSNRFGWSSFLGIPAGSPQVPAGAVPARTANLEGLPPAFIGVGTIDLFYEENLEYARRLAAAGVQVELAIAPGAFHGFTLVRQAKLVQRYESHMMAALRDGLGLPPA
ncbi:alpha/beta hydrolase [Novosphingobium sp. PhB165]|uniref:alpha/beta hydrolase n=1 Tax=Novosphingobium sp. PhB165 TaxID=2485105 RepID=UPI001FB3C662|nr:alpha/beta hydrolase [Novosphingobium sp. PhB165]